MNFNTTNETFRKLLGNGISYYVPMFQRDYSWKEEEWNDLWQDILETCKPDGEPAHYMGYLVLQTIDNKNFDIIDGQQRITTLSLLILAVLKNLQYLSTGEDAEKNKLREDQLRKTYIGYLDPVTLIPRSKLHLNKHNDSLYQNYIVPLQKIPRRDLNASEKLIKQAFEWFVDRVKKDISDNDGAELAKFIDALSDKLFFTVITVNDELNAFKVFETLNARGVRLSATDLLKNYLFSVVSNEKPHETEMKYLEERWRKIVDKLGGEDFSNFLRVYWNSKNKLVRQTNLFKTIKLSIRNKENVFFLIRELDENADFYAALSNSDDEFWYDDEKKHIVELNIFGITQPYSFLMIAYKKLRQDFKKIVRACSIVSFRYNVICGYNPGKQEEVYNDIAYKIARDELTSANDIIQLLKQIYPNDETFIAAFADKDLGTTGRNKKKVRYILFELEKHLSNQDYETESDKYNIEHIMPESPGMDWPDYNENEGSKFIYRLGNYTLLTNKKNREIGNKGFLEKRAIYRDSEFKITQDIAENNNTWDIQRITIRQKTMAKWASSVWRLN